MQVDRNKFFELQKQLESVPFTQTEEWFEHSYEDRTDRMRFFVDSTENPSVAAFGYLRSRKLLGSRLLFDGICKSAACTSKHIRGFFKSIVDEGYDVEHVSDIDEYDPDYEVGIRRAGFRRPFGIHLCPMSMIVDLQKPFSFHRNWRRNVKKAQDNGCTFVAIENPRRDDAKEFVRLFGELKERKALHYSLTEDKLLPLFEKGNYKMFMIKMGVGKYLCKNKLR